MPDLTRRRRSIDRGGGARLLLALPLIVLTGLGGCYQQEDDYNTPASVGGDPVKGATLIAATGCGSCHIVPGIKGADGLVGPPLTHWARRIFIAGLLKNTPENLVSWLRNPQDVVPDNAMPDMGLSDKQARDIAAYLYTIR